MMKQKTTTSYDHIKLDELPYCGKAAAQNSLEIWYASSALVCALRLTDRTRDPES